MKTEAEAIEDARLALPYALGCILACGRERVLDMNSIEKSARLAFPLIMVVLSGFGVRGAWRSMMVDPAAGLVFGLLAAMFLATAIWSLWRGPLALIQGASSMLVVNLIALLSMRSSPGLAERWPNAALYEALAREGLFIWTALLLGGLWLAQRQRRAQS